MSLLIDIADVALKALSAARKASQATGHETSTLEELHNGLSPLRGGLAREKAQEIAANASAGQAAQPTDSTDTDDGFISDVIDWFTNFF